MCITASSLCLENEAVQMLTISLYSSLQPRLEVVHRASYHVGGYCRHFMFSRNFQFMTCTRISQRGDLPWPARSPDFSVCHYFLWGYLNLKVFTP
jgi:hypothetical protein